jgi:hypothetical protein
LSRRLLIRGASAVGCGAALLVAASSGATAQDPPGNNGTVKVDGVEFDSHPDNQPHVGCTFEIDFYGFDEGDLEATVLFEAVPPTGDGELLTDVVAIGEDPASGGVDLDASEEYDLTDQLAQHEPHAQQGWHVRLTVHADGSQGADTKFKEFWVTGCESPPSPTSTTTSTSTTSTTTPTSTTTSSSTTSTTTPGSTTTVPSQPGSPGATPPGSSADALPRTGTNSLPLAAVAVVLVGAGAAGLVIARRLRTGDDTS